MPEGPEVRRCGEMLANLIDGAELSEVRPISGKLFRNNPQGFDVNGHVSSVDVIGKVIIVRVGNRSLVSTLGMSGWWYPSIADMKEDNFAYVKGKLVKTSTVIEQALKHTRLKLIMDSGREINYVDQRNFGNFAVMTHEDAKAKTDHLGYDPLSDNQPDAHYFHIFDALREAGTSKRGVDRLVGELLVDQSVIAGVGNIYRSEILYLSRLSPKRRMGSITLNELSTLATAVREVLAIAYSERGAMVYHVGMLEGYLPMQDLINEKDLSTDHFIPRHLVYGCRHDIFGNPVIAEKMDGRTAWYVPEIQT